MRRRSVLRKSALASTIGGMGLSSVSVASAAGRKSEYAGVMYEPSKSEILGKGRAELRTTNAVDGELKGTFHLGKSNFSVSFDRPDQANPLSEVSPVERDHRPVRKYNGTKPSRAKGQTPLSISITGMPSGMFTGIVQHPGYDDSRGFCVDRVEPNETRSDVVGRMADIVRGDL